MIPSIPTPLIFTTSQYPYQPWPPHQPNSEHKDIYPCLLSEAPAWTPTWALDHSLSMHSNLDSSSPNLFISSITFLPTSHIRNYLLCSSWYIPHITGLNTYTLNQTFRHTFPPISPLPCARVSFLWRSSFPTHPSTKHLNFNSSPNLQFYSFIPYQSFLKAQKSTYLN